MRYFLATSPSLADVILRERLVFGQNGHILSKDQSFASIAKNKASEKVAAGGRFSQAPPSLAGQKHLAQTPCFAPFFDGRPPH